MKIAINKCFGGFQLSPLAEKLIAERKGIRIVFKNGFTGDEVSFEDVIKSWRVDIYSNLEDLKRNDPDLIAVIEEIGQKANTPVSDICIVEIPDDVEWVVEEYDGMEWISEKHRVWG